MRMLWWRTLAGRGVNPVRPCHSIETSLTHEQYISDLIFNLKDLCRKESDHATDVFLEWFVREQIEEEASVRTVVDQLKLVQGQPNGLFMIDRELASRPAANVITSGLGVARE